MRDRHPFNCVSKCDSVLKYKENVLFLNPNRIRDEKNCTIVIVWLCELKGVK